MKYLIPFLFICLLASCQKETAFKEQDQKQIKAIYDHALTKANSYEWLRDLTQNIGGRLSGSPEAAEAVAWGERLMQELKFDTVYLQPVIGNYLR